MGIISAWIVKSPRIHRQCAGHMCFKSLPPGKSLLRIYGNAFGDDPCFSMYVCLECAGNSSDEKIQKPLNCLEPDYIKDLPF